VLLGRAGLTRGVGARAAQAINTAYGVLSDPAARRSYDLSTPL